MNVNFSMFVAFAIRETAVRDKVEVERGEAIVGPDCVDASVRPECAIDGPWEHFVLVGIDDGHVQLPYEPQEILLICASFARRVKIGTKPKGSRRPNFQ